MPIDSRDWYKRRIKCPFCGNPIYPRQSHCSFCGRELPVSPRPRGPIDWEKEQGTKKPRDGTGTDGQKSTEEAPRLRTCTVCGQVSLFWNARDGSYECLNPGCHATGKTPDAVFSWESAMSRLNEGEEDKQEHIAEKQEETQEHVDQKQEERQEQVAEQQPERFSTERGGLAKDEQPVSGRAWWGNAYYDVKKRRWRTPARSPLWIAKLCLNLLILVCLGFLIQFGYKAFTQRSEPVKDAIVLIIGITAWILVIRLSRSRRFKWVRPSFALTTFSVVSVLLILSFAGVQPFSTYKDGLISAISSYFRSTNESGATPSPSDTAVSLSNEVNSRNGEFTTPDSLPLRCPRQCGYSISR